MKTSIALSVALLWFAIVTATVSAQVQTIQIGPGGASGAELPMQFPGIGRQMKTGIGRIKGRIVTTDTGAPVRRAQVRISASETMPRSAVTDNEGRYEFRDLPAGKYTITATKSGFVSVQYGQTRPYEQGKSVELIESQPIDKADISMPRGSVISGRVLDEFGDPLPDAAVSAMRSSWVNGKRRLQPTGRAGQTNDLGQYRIYGLAPGDYYVSATLRGGAEMMMMDMAMMASFTTGPQLSGSEPRSGYAPTYYPGTTNGGEAQKIVLAVGQEAQNTDFGMLSVKLARVAGTVIGSDGRPVEGAMINATPRNAGDTAFSPLGQGRTDKNGNFTLASVAPGDYTLRATGVRMAMSGGEVGGDQMVLTTRVSMGGDGQTEFGAVPLAVTGEDVSNVMIITSKGTTVTGRVTWEGGSKPTGTTAPLRITAVSIDTDSPRGMGLPGGGASVAADGAFEIKGVAGQRLVRPGGVPQGWGLKSVRHNGQDVTDTGIDVKPGEPVSGLEVVLTSKTTEVNGSVTLNNQPAADYTVVIFAEDPQKWTAPMTRYITGIRPNQDGRFQVKNLPAGRYYAIALDYIAQGEWNDPEVLERIKSKATRFTLEDGRIEALELKLSGG